MEKIIAASVFLLNSSVFAWQPFIDINAGESIATNSALKGYSAGEINKEDGTYDFKYFGESGSNHSGRLGVGVMLNNYLGVEVSYTKLFNNIKSSMDIGPNGINEYDQRSWNLTQNSKSSSILGSVILNIPITRNGLFYLHERTGIVYNKITNNILAISNKGPNCPVDNHTCDAVTEPTSYSSTGLGLELGLGLGYHFTQYLSAEISYDNLGTLTDNHNIQMYTVGIKYLI